MKMRSMHLLLDGAERKWRDEIKTTFPLRADTKVVKNTKPDGRDWTFSTDLKQIFASISGDESLREKFQKVIPRYWDGEPEKLAEETLHYLLYHELYHPVEAPFSVSGPDSDNKKIHQAIRRGLLKAEPKLSALEQVVRVSSSENTIKDFILDNRFYLDNQQGNYVRQDIIPTWDVLELQEAPTNTNLYTVTRLLYGMFYGPEKAHELFREKSGKEGQEVAEKAMSKLLGKSVKLPKNKATILEKAKKFVGMETDEQTKLPEYVKGIREVFSGEDRYKGIERMMSVLGPYVKKDMPQPRKDLHGEGTGGSPQSILQDLLDDMTPEEQSQFTQELASQGGQALAEAAQQIQSGEKRPQSENPSADELNNLDIIAAHEYYKRNHPRVTIVGGSKLGESVVIGKKEYWALKNSTILTQADLRKVNLSRIDSLQRKTRLPWLIDLGNGTYRLDEYTPKERDIKDIVYVDQNLSIPDVTEFYLDSSGSMFKQEEGIVFKPNDGSSWDMLSYVLYGLTDALRQAGTKLGRHGKIRLHNFADSQVSTEIMTVDDFWNGRMDAIKTLYRPENGYNQEDLNLKDFNDGKDRAYVVVTDGNLVIGGRTEREAAKMKRLATNPHNTVSLFEIGGTYSLGNAVKGTPSIIYHPVHNKEKMLEAGLEVLLSKREETKGAL